MGTGSIQLARLFGIRIGASPSWFVVLFLMIYYLSGVFDTALAGNSNDTAYVVAVIGAVLFFVSLVLHELGHALVARRDGIGVSSIDLWFFGGLAKLTRDPTTPGEEFRVAAAGPAVTLAILVACCGALAALGVTDLGDGADPLVRHDHAREGPGRVAGRDQRRRARLQPDPGVPARRRPDRPRDRLEGHRRPQPRDAPRGAPRPGASRGA